MTPPARLQRFSTLLFYTLHLHHFKRPLANPQLHESLSVPISPSPEQHISPPSLFLRRWLGTPAPQEAAVPGSPGHLKAPLRLPPSRTGGEQRPFPPHPPILHVFFLIPSRSPGRWAAPLPAGAALPRAAAAGGACPWGGEHARGRGAAAAPVGLCLPPVAERARRGPRALPWLARRAPSRALRLLSLLRPRPPRWVTAREARGRGRRGRGGRRGLARPVMRPGPSRPVPRLPGGWRRACARLSAAVGSARGPHGSVWAPDWRPPPGASLGLGSRAGVGRRWQRGPPGGDSGVGLLRGCGRGWSDAFRRRYRLHFQVVPIRGNRLSPSGASELWALQLQVVFALCFFLFLACNNDFC